ncbi:MAG: 50S ribosomal protein L7/L12 [Parachlamydiales bacterium]|nr:50S ribosomal protein L7/L12 [Parachlamydiales bacterium]
MEKEALVEALSNLTVLQMAELKTALEEKWGVKAMAAAAAPAAAPAAAEAAVESTEFQVTLSEAPADAKKISVIKVVREVTGLGLKEAKDLVEGAPKLVKTGVNKAEAEEIAKKITDAGAKATIKGL